MIFDIVAVVVLVLAIVSGYRDGFLKSLLRSIGYIAGAIGGLYLALQYNKSAWVILAIILGATVGTWLGSAIAKALKITIVRGPLAWFNSLIGALLDGAKVIIAIYLIGTVLLWAPWSTGKDLVSESKVYLEINAYAPSIIMELREQIELKFQSA
jgi:NAD/NADP transhydrogenase beta subunit